MNEQQQHEMILEGTNESGEENWYCPTCGRRMIITWHPWKKVVLDQGDFYANHSANKGGLKLGSTQIMPVNEDSASYAAGTSIEDPYLAPWKRWLEKKDADDLWNKEV
jgi:hypothetical protein